MSYCCCCILGEGNWRSVVDDGSNLSVMSGGNSFDFWVWEGKMPFPRRKEAKIVFAFFFFLLKRQTHYQLDLRGGKEGVDWKFGKTTRRAAMYLFTWPPKFTGFSFLFLLYLCLKNLPSKKPHVTKNLFFVNIFVEFHTSLATWLSDQRRHALKGKQWIFRSLPHFGFPGGKLMNDKYLR